MFPEQWFTISNKNKNLQSFEIIPISLVMADSAVGRNLGDWTRSTCTTLFWSFFAEGVAIAVHRDSSPRPFSMLDSVTAAETVFGEALSRLTSGVREEVVVAGTVRLTFGKSLRKGA